MRVLVITNMYPSEERPWLGTFVEQQVVGLQAIGVVVEVLFFDRKTEGPLIYYRMGSRVAAAIAGFRPDLIHVMYGGVMADQITRRFRSIPVVVTFHGSDLLGENLSGPFRKLVSHYGIHCSRKAARRAAGVVVVARHLLEALPAQLSTHSSHPSTIKARIIPCGIDLERFRPMNPVECRKRLGWSKDGFHVLFASSNSDPVKRPWLAEAAVGKLREQGVDAELHLLSSVPHNDVPTWINASGVLILTSLHEGSPTVVKECLACGVPVVSVDVGDVAERIVNIAGCYLAEPDSIDLALKLEAIFESDQRLYCRSQIEDLSHLAVALKLEDFYRDILSMGH